jgi:hypothetical protein
MFQFADLVVLNPLWQIVLIVEAKNRIGTSRMWAAETRRNMYSHRGIPSSPYFMIATPERFYLWKEAGSAPNLVEPSYEIDAVPFLEPYIGKGELSPINIGYHTFELLITAWIHELVNWGVSSSAPDEWKSIFHNSGLLEALKDAKVVIDLPS